MKLIPLLLISLLLHGCAILHPQPKHAVSPDQQAFNRAFTDFQEDHRATGFHQLMEDFPDSVWAGRAETIILYSQELERQKAQNQKLRKAKQQQSLELQHLSQQNQQLIKQVKHLDKSNQQLADKIEKLKNLLIQSEKYSPK